ncbi:MAG: helix-turn-helix domain-containing protein [Planctomycetaceae bacterium]|nr:helix-turn-helix domain-containing protein [Planctomycetaceae bacterium]
MASSSDTQSGTPDELLTVSQAAALLGVTSATLRNWDRAGKLKAVRHPINGYRIYQRSVIEALNRELHGKQSE